jgi:hypothetical protein
MERKVEVCNDFLTTKNGRAKNMTKDRSSTVVVVEEPGYTRSRSSETIMGSIRIDATTAALLHDNLFLWTSQAENLKSTA